MGEKHEGMRPYRGEMDGNSARKMRAWLLHIESATLEQEGIERGNNVKLYHRSDYVEEFRCKNIRRSEMKVKRVSSSKFCQYT